MTTWSNPNDNSYLDSDDSMEFVQFEKIRRRQEAVWGVGADTPRRRAERKSRGGPAARRKSRLIHGIARRGYRHLVPTF